MKRIVYASMLVAALAMLVPSLAAAPRLEIPESEFNFGYVPQNSKVSHTFWLYNHGDDSLIIKKVVPG